MLVALARAFPFIFALLLLAALNVRVDVGGTLSLNEVKLCIAGVMLAGLAIIVWILLSGRRAEPIPVDRPNEK
jgi:hypothetical protein